MPDVPFPNNVVDTLALSLADLTGVDTIVKRPLRINDGDHFIGISAMEWRPVDREFSGPDGPWDAGINRYLFRIEALIRVGSTQEGLANQAIFAKSIRTMLYRDQTLRIRLASLQESLGGVIERVSRWQVNVTRFASNEVKGKFLYLSTTEFQVETSTG